MIARVPPLPMTLAAVVFLALAPAARADVDLTATMKPLVVSTRHDPASGTTTVRVTLRNVSSKIATGPFRLVVRGLGNDVGRLVGPKGYTVDGQPLYVFPEVKLSPGRTTRAREIVFGTRCTAGVRAAFKPFGAASAFPVISSCGKDSATYFTVVRPDPARNSSPVADAGPDLGAGVRQMAFLDGTGSTDRDGNRLAYSWTLASRPRGSAAVVKSARTPLATLTPDRAGTYVARLTVSDGAGGTSVDQVRISTGKLPPRAMSGPDLSVAVGSAATLDASGSTDANTDPLTPRWSIVSAPAGSTARLSSVTALRPTLTPDRAGRYAVQLVVKDGALVSPPDFCVVSTAGTAPVADPGTDRIVGAGETVVLDGSRSTDADGDRLGYSWALLLRPAGSTAAIAAPQSLRTSFVADVPGRYVAQLVASDARGAGLPATASFAAGNLPPVADAGPDLKGTVGQVVNLDGSNSAAVGGGPVTHRWWFSAKPAGSAAILTGQLTAQPSFTPDVEGVYTVQLRVDDGTRQSAPDTCVVSTGGSLPCARPGSDAAADVGDLVSLDGAASADADGDPLAFSWSLLHAPAGSVASLATPLEQVSSFRPDLPGPYVAQLVVHDGASPSPPATVAVDAAVRMITVPSVVGQPRAAAELALVAAFLVVGTGSEAHSIAVPAGSVISQDPAGGASVAKWSPVSLVVSLGPQLAPVPGLLGLTEAAAGAALGAAGFVAGAVGTAYDESVAAGTVLSQIPAAGVVRPQGSAVHYTLSLGPVVPPPDPAGAAPAVDLTVATNTATATDFLHSGPDPTQRGVAPGTIDRERAAAIRGKVVDRAGLPLPGVRVAVHRHAEFGHTVTRADGMYDLVVNGGGYLTLEYDKAGHLAIQRQLSVGWQQWVWAPEVALVPIDTATTVVDFTQPVQAARGSVVADARGTRRSTLLFREGTAASAVLPDGSTVPLPSITVRSTEYTVGATGPQAMPAELPAGVAYTWAAELSVDEAAGAAGVSFDRPVAHYVENFLDFPVGVTVPAYTYSRDRAVWVPLPGGKVIEVLGETAGLADVDIDGDGLADGAAELAALGIDEAERGQLAILYAAGTELWRVALTHFSPVDYNWPPILPPDATPPTPPSPPSIRDPGLDCPSRAGGSILECENQVLGEAVPVTGTPYRLSYRSSRAPGFKAAYTLQIPLTGAAYPDSLVDVRVVVDIAGQHTVRMIPPGPDLTFIYEWNGLDAFGRPLQGEQPVKVRIGFSYRAAYGCSGVPGCPGADILTLWSEWDGYLGRSVSAGQGFGGWSLDVQHAYNPLTRVFDAGGGASRTADSLLPAVETHLGPALPGFGPLGFAASLEPAPDGSLYFQNQNDVFRADREGSVSRVAGNGDSRLSGDGGPATAAGLDAAGIALGPDGSLYVADRYNHRVRRVDASGIITTVAGSGPTGSGNGSFAGDGGPAVSARLSYPWDVAVARDGTLYIADEYNARVRRVTTGGVISTVVGGGDLPAGDGVAADEVFLRDLYDVEVGPDGALYFCADNSVFKVGPRDRLERIAGTLSGDGGAYPGDGGQARDAYLPMRKFDIGGDGSLYIADERGDRVRLVTPRGVIRTIAGRGDGWGNGSGFSGDGGPAAMAEFNALWGVALGPDRRLYIADTGNRRIRVMGVVPERYSAGGVLVPAADGTESYLFDSSGRHLQTFDALTGAVTRRFRYGATGLLAEVEDAAGNVTTIERDGDGNPLAIVAPGGQRTALTLDQNGYLAGIDDPAGEGWSFTYTAGGLMTGAADPGGAAWAFSYDADGLLERDDHPAGGFQTLAKTPLAGGFAVTRGTALGRTTTYAVESLANGDSRRTVASAAAGSTETAGGADGVVTITRPDGAVVTLAQGPDPRFGMQAPIVESAAVALPSGLTRGTTLSRAVTLADPADILSLATATETLKVNGRAFTRTYDATTRESLLTTPAGRQAARVFDAQGRVVERRTGTLAPAAIAYDTAGRPATVTAGSGPEARAVAFAYDTAGRLSVLTDPLGRTLTFGYDAADRLVSLELPGGRTISYGHDAAGNLTSLAPPGRPAHALAYRPGGLPLSYTPPDVGGGTGPTGYTHNLDGQLTGVALPGGATIGVRYAASGLPEAMELPAGDLAFGWHGTTKQLVSATMPGGQGLALAWDGFLPAGETWSGPIPGSVAWTRDASFRVVGESVNGAPDLAFTYDDDDLLVGAGAASLARDAATGLLTGITVGGVAESIARNAFGEVVARQVTGGAGGILEVAYTRDNLGRIVGMTETVEGTSQTYGYAYDAAGRLESVTRGGAAWQSFVYDANGNRASLTGPGGTVAAGHDSQDRLLTQGPLAFAYTPAGFLATRTDTGSGGVTSYTYDPLGNLANVVLPDGRTVAYTVDAFGRRVGKSVDGTPVKGFLYRNRLNPVAELDATGAVVSRFVYGSRANVPDYLVKGGVTYRIVADHLGSPRLVVNVADGTVAQRMDYDPWGRVILDDNPGFQPFGFAGGLYDPDTGLVRFGARDYDAETGRWTAKDPIGFSGGDANLYSYVRSDPVNFLDPGGKAHVANTVVGIGSLIQNVGNLVALSDAALGTGGLILPVESVVATGGAVAVGGLPVAMIAVGSLMAGYNLTSLAMDAVQALSGYDPADILSDLLLPDDDLDALIDADAVLCP